MIAYTSIFLAIQYDLNYVIRLRNELVPKNSHTDPPTPPPKKKKKGKRNLRSIVTSSLKKYFRAKKKTSLQAKEQDY